MRPVSGRIVGRTFLGFCTHLKNTDRGDDLHEIIRGPLGEAYRQKENRQPGYEGKIESETKGIPGGKEKCSQETALNGCQSFQAEFQ